MDVAHGWPETLGEFRLHGRLGAGGSGVVYDATWGPRRVALKVLHAELLATGSAREQFLGEARRLQQIGHPSVVKVLAVGELPDGRPYLAMERLDGETLASAIARSALPLGPALDLFDELCGAVSALHAQGLVHRDLKPENVFVVGGRHAVLLDFGIAKDLAAPASTTTQEGNVRGTPAYMAPERFFGQAAGVATDIYELALVLYAMLAGRLPWTDSSDPEARLAPASLVELADVPEAVDVAIRRALSTRAQNRPASAAALAQVVRDAAGAIAREPGAAETARMRPERDASAPTSAPTSTQDSALAPQPTPLAWAPTQAASVATAKQPRRTRWLYAGLAAAVVGGAATFAYVHGQDATTTATTGSATPVTPLVATPIPGAPDPWAAPVATPAQRHEQSDETALPLVDPPRTPAAYRAELAAAVGKLPGDTRVIMAVEIGELTSTPEMRALVGRAFAWPKLSDALAAVPPCIQAIAARGEWIAFGTSSVAAADSGTFIVRGRWRRADVEACLAKDAHALPEPDGAKIWQIEADGWLEFLDDHTAYVSMRVGGAEQVHRERLHPGGPPSHTRELFGTLPADRAFAFVADGRARDTWDTVPIPTGSDVTAWLRVDATGVALDAAADPHVVADAQAIVDANAPKVDDLFGFVSAEKMGKLVVDRQGTAAHLHGALTTAMLQLLAKR